MVVTVIAVGVMQVTVDDVVDMVAMRDGLVAASRAVDVIDVVSRAAMPRGAPIGIRFGNFERVLVAMSLVRMMQSTIMKIIDVIVVDDRRMAAVGSMNMRMIDDGFTGRHGSFLQFGLVVVIGVRQQVFHEKPDVVISQLVIHVLPLAPSVQQLCGRQNLQALGNQG